MTGPANGGRFPAMSSPWERGEEPVEDVLKTEGPRKVRPKSLRRLFEQGKHWRRADGTWVRVRDMHPAHRANAARMLLRNAAAYAGLVSWSDVRTLAGAPDEVVNDAFREDAERSADPEKWMRSTKLYRRLVKGLPTEHAVAPPERRVRSTLRPDGTWTAGPVPEIAKPPGLPTDHPVHVREMDGAPDDIRFGATRALQRVRSVASAMEGSGVRLDYPAVHEMVAEAARQIGVTL